MIILELIGLAFLAYIIALGIEAYLKRRNK